MHHGLVPYLVPLDSVKAFWGCHQPAMVARIAERFRQEMQDNEVVHRQEIAAGAPTLAAALEELSSGQASAVGHGFQYASALELLCAHYGELLPNDPVYPIERTWLKRELDPIFQRWNIAHLISAERMIGGAWPLPIPSPQDLPAGGTIELSTILEIVAVMRNTPPPELRGNAIPVIGQMRQWLETASARQLSIVFFYY